ncbi:Arginine biosynthesis protein ArgJ [Macrophomina phaseolina MS6]|uniref:Arginine biosynthesis protein ArgJ n=1 Tax=Macrophomina phaseolina (strain MS6) TaxID=1126212 RepID=K2RYZ4_MACPH|nr:Arginine biosynthesis protein ArgJ [Macrophomina phaseolina MS6]
MVAMLANGAADRATVTFDPVVSTFSPSADFRAMQRTLSGIAADLAKLFVPDGEGAIRPMVIRMRNSPPEAAARLAAGAVARSVLCQDRGVRR